MSMDSIIAGDYGQIITLTVLDADTSAAANISGYSTTITMMFKDPDKAISTVTAAFPSDGTSGGVRYTLTTGDIYSSGGGDWEVRARVFGGSARLSSEWLKFTVQS